MPITPVSIEDVARDAAACALARFRETCASSRALTDRDTIELREIIYQVARGLVAPTSADLEQVATDASRAVPSPGAFAALHDIAAEVLDEIDKSPEYLDELTPRQRNTVVDAAHKVLVALVQKGCRARVADAARAAAEATPGAQESVEIAPGDVVRLRSGGPLMTVQNVVQPTDMARKMGQAVPAVQIVWIDERSEPHATAVGAPALERVAGRAPELLVLARALFDHPKRYDGEQIGVFDYSQRGDGHRLIAQFLEVLNSYDGGARAWPFVEEV